MQRTILAIGQTLATTQHIHSIVQADGFAIVTVPTVEAALKQINPSVALVLLHPEAGSVSALRAENHYLPIIMLADESHAATMIKGLRMGANDVLMTPVDKSVALARMDTQLRLRDQLEARDAEIDRLRREKATQERLVRIINHDIKHPMGNIRMAEGLLRRYISDSPKGTTLLDSMLIALDSMEETLRDFTDAVHLKDSMRLDVEPVPVIQPINDSTLEHLAGATAKNMIIDVQPSDATVLADPRRLHRVIDNLISNAIKYSLPASTITIRVEENDNTARICVQDQGPGIPETERHLLFTEFGKLSTRPTGEETSTGLGLWIVKMLVEAMGGKVGAEAAPEGGTIFWVELPITHTIDVMMLETREAKIVVNYDAS